MPKELVLIAARIRELREVLEISSEEMATSLGLGVEAYEEYESARQDIPISLLYSIAKKFGVDFTVLLSGDAPRMADYTLVRRGGGLTVDRYPGYRFQNLAFNYVGRTMEPMIVGLDPEEGDPALVCHGGQEFNYVLEGKVCVILGKHRHELSEGDSIYFNPRLPHGQRAIGGKAVFLTVIQE